jgi:uncharacterized protein
MLKKRNWFTARTHRFSLALYVVLILTAAFFIPGLQVIGGIDEQILPSDHPYSVTTSAWQHFFPVRSMIVLSAAFADNRPFTQENLTVIEEIIGEISRWPMISTVYALTDLDEKDSESLSHQPLIDLDDTRSIADAEHKIDKIEILKSLFLTPDSQALLIYITAEEDADAVEFGRLIDILKADWESRGVRLSAAGTLYHDYQSRQIIIRELLLICITAFIILLIVYYVFTGSKRISLLFLVNSVIPSLILFGFMALFRQPIDIMTIFLPLLLFSITTAYSIHYYKTSEIIGDRTAALQSIGIIIVLSALTTMIGFANLLFIQGESVRKLAVVLILGIVLSVFSVLWCIPPVVERVPAGKSRRWEVRLRSSLFPAGKKSAIFRTLYVLAVLTVCGGLYWYGPQWNYKDGFTREFRPWTPIRQETERFSEHSGTIQELNVFIDTGADYGLINMEFYRHLEELTRKLRAFEHTAMAVSYTDVTAYGNGLLYGEQADIPPESEAEIGETLELVTSSRNDIPLDLFTDPAYRRTRLMIQYDTSDTTDPHELYQLNRQVTDIIEDHMAGFPVAEIHTTGYMILLENLIRYYLILLSRASLFFFGLILLLGLAILRSVKKSLLLIFPSLMGTLFYIGISGWFRQPISVFNIFGLYTLLGISVDDTFYFLIHHSREERRLQGRSGYDITTSVYRLTGINILETTFIITFGVSAALISGVVPIFSSVLITLTALHFSTTTTLFIMPRFLYNRREVPR